MIMTTDVMVDRRGLHEQSSNVDDLKALLEELTSSENTVSIRLKLEGEEWPAYFSQVLVFVKHATLLAHMPSRTVINVPDLKRVTAFELEAPYKSYRAFCAYSIQVTQPTKHPNNGLLHA